MGYNNGSYGGFSSFRLEDGKVIGKLRVGVKPAFPSAGGQDYRFFIEPLSPIPRGYEGAMNVGFTGFMSRIGYDCSFFASEKEAWETLSAEWGDGLVLFTPALRNNRYFVLDDAQKEARPVLMEEDTAFLPVPVFTVDEGPVFDGDVNRFCFHLAEGKPLPGLSKKYWDRTMLPPLVIAAFRTKDESRRRMYAVFAPLRGDLFQSAGISEGGAYFDAGGRGNLGYVLLDLASPEIASHIVLCRTAPLAFIPKELIAFLKKDMQQVPADCRVFRSEESRPKPAALRGVGHVPHAVETLEGESIRSVTEAPARPAAPVRTPASVRISAPSRTAAHVPTLVHAGPAGETSAPAPHVSVPAPAPAPAPEAPKAEAPLTEKAFLARFAEAAEAKGFIYDKKDLVNFHVSAKASRLVILAGMSGSGKSALVRLYAEALGLPASQLAVIPVRPSWMDDSDILGYPDLKTMLYRPADTGLAELLIDAARHPEKLYIVCFDEMNLARAEHYFAQFISVLEREEEPRLRLYNPELAPRLYNGDKYPAEIPIGRNVLFTGTVNVDESTYHFSDKILDRANVITLTQGRFRDLLSLSKKEKEKYPEVTAALFASWQRLPGGIALLPSELDFLDALNDAIRASALPGGIGYRVARQMGRYLENIPEGAGFTREEGLDCQTVQRILTKLRGSAEQLKSLISLDENGAAAGDAAAVLAKYRGLSDFEKSRRVLLRKAKELKLYDYTI